MRLHSMCCAAGLFSVVAPLAAATNDISTNAAGRHVLPRVLVTAKAPRLGAGAAVFKGQDLRARGDRTLGEALAGIPGVDVTGVDRPLYGLVTGQGSVSVRGVAGSPNTGVLMLVNGRPSLMPMFGHPLWDAYPSLALDQAEVLKGPASARWGSGALGGAMLISTAPGKDDLNLYRASFGSWSTLSQTVMRDGSLGADARYRVFANYTQTAGELSNTDGNRGSGLVHVVATPAAEWRLEAIGMGTWLRFNEERARTFFFSWTSGGRMLRLDGDLAAHWTGKTAKVDARLFVNHGDHRLEDGFNSTDVTLGALVDWRWEFAEGWRAGAGTQLQRAMVDYNKGAASGTPNLGQHDVYGAVARTAGALTGEATVRLAHDSYEKSIVVPGITVACALGAGQSLSATAARGYRLPSLMERSYVNPNADLEPESAWGVEATYRFAPATGIELSATPFWLKADNMIVQVGSTRSNTGAFEHWGVELAVTWAPAAAVKLAAGYVFLEPHAATANAARHMLSARVDAEPLAGLAVFLAARGQANRYAGDKATLDLGDYLVLDLGATWKAAPWLDVFVKARNAGDKAYAAYRVTTVTLPPPPRPYLYPAARLSAEGGVTLRF